MNLILRSASTLALLAAALAAPAQGLLGSSVHGELHFYTYPAPYPNYFDPANGDVPSGFLNATQGPTVTVADPDVEFGFESAFDFDTVDLTADTIVLTDVVTRNAVPATYTLADDAFAGLTFTETSDTFPGGATITRQGNTLTIVTPLLMTAGTHSLTLSASPVPEPSAFAALGVGALAMLRRRRGALAMLRRRRRA